MQALIDALCMATNCAGGDGAVPKDQPWARPGDRTGWLGARGLRQAPCVSMGSIYWWSEGTLQSEIVLNGQESDGGRDDPTT